MMDGRMSGLLETMQLGVVLISARFIIAEADNDNASSLTMIPHEEWNRTFRGLVEPFQENLNIQGGIV